MSEIRVHKDMESLSKTTGAPLYTYGAYDSKNNIIHILEKDYMYNLVLEHEIIHSERKNTLISKLARIGCELFLILGYLCIFGSLTMICRYLNQILLSWIFLLLLLISLLPNIALMIDEYIV